MNLERQSFDIDEPQPGPSWAPANWPQIDSDDLTAARARIVAAGGTITCDIFAFPGGQRFHFREPSGIELAVWSDQ